MKTFKQITNKICNMFNLPKSSEQPETNIPQRVVPLVEPTEEFKEIVKDILVKNEKEINMKENKLELLIDGEFYDFVKKNDVTAQSSAKLKFGNSVYSAMYNNIFIEGLRIYSKGVIKVSEEISDDEVIKYICENQRELEVIINNKITKFRSQFILVQKSCSNYHIEDLTLFEFKGESNA